MTWSTDEEDALAHTPADQLLQLPFLRPDVLSDPGTAYALAKRANQLRVRSASGSWGERGARINSISPGVIATSMGRAELASNSGAFMRAMVEASASRRLGTPEDIAAATAFLLGPDASFVSGTDLLVDGGGGRGAAVGSRRRRRLTGALQGESRRAGCVDRVPRVTCELACQFLGRCRLDLAVGLSGPEVDVFRVADPPPVGTQRRRQMVHLRVRMRRVTTEALVEPVCDTSGEATAEGAGEHRAGRGGRCRALGVGGSRLRCEKERGPDLGSGSTGDEHGRDRRSGHDRPGRDERQVGLGSDQLQRGEQGEVGLGVVVDEHPAMSSGFDPLHDQGIGPGCRGGSCLFR